eukprot:COSAG03_NODE_1909_length_3367_cov_9.998164_5_plen_80_part_00
MLALKGKCASLCDNFKRLEVVTKRVFLAKNDAMVSYFVLHTDLVSSFGGCMAQASYFDTARRLSSFLAKKTRFVTTSNR